jgi:hypothetical protein
MVAGNFCQPFFNIKNSTGKQCYFDKLRGKLTRTTVLFKINAQMTLANSFAL